MAETSGKRDWQALRQIAVRWLYEQGEPARVEDLARRLGITRLDTQKYVVTGDARSFHIHGPLVWLTRWGRAEAEGREETPAPYWGTLVSDGNIYLRNAVRDLLLGPFTPDQARLLADLEEQSAADPHRARARAASLRAAAERLAGIEADEAVVVDAAE